MSDQRYVFVPGDTLRRGKRPLRIGEAAPFGHGGGFFSNPDDEDTAGPVAMCCFELEDGSGTILTEDGAGCIDPENCP